MIRCFLEAGVYKLFIKFITTLPFHKKIGWLDPYRYFHLDMVVPKNIKKPPDLSDLIWWAPPRLIMLVRG